MAAAVLTMSYRVVPNMLTLNIATRAIKIIMRAYSINPCPSSPLSLIKKILVDESTGRNKVVIVSRAMRITSPHVKSVTVDRKREWGRSVRPAPHLEICYLWNDCLSIETKSRGE